MPCWRMALTGLIVGSCLMGPADRAFGQTLADAGGPRRADFLRTIERPEVPLAPSAPVLTDSNGLTREHFTFESEPGERVPVLAVRRTVHAQTPRPVVIVLHGTDGAKEGMATLLETYASRGFLAVAIDGRHHGERATPIPGLPDPYQSAMLQSYRTGIGHPYLYDTVWDVLRLVDYLASRTDVDAARIGLIGNSKGGTEAYLAAAADPRIGVVVPLIGVQSFGWSLRHVAGWEARTWTFRGAVEAAAASEGLPVGAAFM